MVELLQNGSRTENPGMALYTIVSATESTKTSDGNCPYMQNSPCPVLIGVAAMDTQQSKEEQCMTSSRGTYDGKERARERRMVTCRGAYDGTERAARAAVCTISIVLLVALGSSASSSSSRQPHSRTYHMIENLKSSLVKVHSALIPGTSIHRSINCSTCC